MNGIDDLLRRIESYDTALADQDLLLTWERSPDELRCLLDVAEALRRIRAENVSARCFDSGLAISHFRDNSTRTRFSFASAANLLGLAVQDLDEGSSQIAHGETVRETAVMISFASEVIGIRDDMYLGAGNAYMREVGAALEEARAEGVLPQRPSIVNLQCDLDHPTQSLADLRHLVDRFGSLEGLRGKKLAMSWAYSPSYGKPLSVPQGIIGLMTRFGMDVVLAHPEGYELVDEPLDAARRFAGESDGSFEVVHSMGEAFAGADVVYPKSWAPLSVMEKRTELLRGGRADELAELERDALAQNALHREWTCTQERMKTTRDGSALYLHCLPADVSGVSCAAGEVSESVFEQHRLDTYREASHKPFVIAAMILLTRFAEPAEVLRACIDKGVARRVLG